MLNENAYSKLSDDDKSSLTKEDCIEIIEQQNELIIRQNEVIELYREQGKEQNELIVKARIVIDSAIKYRKENNMKSNRDN